MVKVTIDREGCVSCGTCEDTCPGFFQLNPDDTLSQVIEKYRTGGRPDQGDAPEDLLPCIREAAELCPVQVIQVYD